MNVRIRNLIWYISRKHKVSANNVRSLVEINSWNEINFRVSAHRRSRYRVPFFINSISSIAIFNNWYSTQIFDGTIKILNSRRYILLFREFLYWLQRNYVSEVNCLSFQSFILLKYNGASILYRQGYVF